MIKFIDKQIENIRKKIDSLSSKKKLVLAIVFLLIMMFIVNVIFKRVLKSEDNIINYSRDMSGNTLEVYSSYFDEKDIYIQLNSIASNFIKACREDTYDKKGKKITLNRIYEDILYYEYRNYIYKSKFKDNTKKFLEKIDNMQKINSNLIPSSIKLYEENFYLLKYSETVDEEEISAWLGIALDENNGLYYVWYVE